MPFTKFTNLDFDQIKTQIKSYLRANSDFKDFDFDGSNFSVLIDTLAYNTYITAFNSNMVVNESFLDSATLRENVVSLARNIGYVPRSRRAARMVVDYDITGITSTTETITFQPGLIGNGAISNVNYLFSIPEKVTGVAFEGRAAGNFEVFQGQYLETRFTVNDSLPNQRYILPNDGVDTSTIRINVKENNASTTTTEYKLVDNIIGVTSVSYTHLRAHET